MEGNLLNKYHAELENDLDLSDFNIKDVQSKLPANKHKWVSRLIDHKIELSKIKKLRGEAVEKISEKIKNESIVILSDVILKKRAENADIIKKIDQKMEDVELIIEYLEKIEKICNSATYDVKNLIELKKMEYN